MSKTLWKVKFVLRKQQSAKLRKQKFPTILCWQYCRGGLCVYLESMASGVITSDPVIIAIARPGASLVSTSRVAWIFDNMYTHHRSNKLYAHLWSDIPAGKSSTTGGKNKTQFQVITPFLQYLLQITPTYYKWTVVQDIILPVYPAHCLVHRLSRHVLLLYSVCRITTHDT